MTSSSDSAAAHDQETDSNVDGKVLAAARLAFERGDYKLTRQLTTRLMEQSANEEITEGAARLRAQVETDPLTKYLLLLTGLLLVTVTLFAFVRGHG